MRPLRRGPNRPTVAPEWMPLPNRPWRLALCDGSGDWVRGTPTPQWPRGAVRGFATAPKALEWARRNRYPVLQPGT